jgi:hypothetical protein
LIVDAVYEGKDSQLSSGPISRLLPGCGNMGGLLRIKAAFVSDDQHEKIDTNTHISLQSRALRKSATHEVSAFYVPMDENLAPSTEEHISVEWND